jgi:hypothetical protein
VRYQAALHSEKHHCKTEGGITPEQRLKNTILRKQRQEKWNTICLFQAERIIFSFPDKEK